MSLQQQVNDNSEMLKQLTKKDWEYVYFAVEDRFINELDKSLPETVVRILT